MNFYGSITPEILKKAIEYAKQFVDISDDEESTILQATHSFLCSYGTIWIKKEGGTFDVTMGGFHGAEICDLVGLFILSQLKEVTTNIGLYRDDGLAIVSGTSRQNEITKKKIL